MHALETGKQDLLVSMASDSIVSCRSPAPMLSPLAQKKKGIHDEYLVSVKSDRSENVDTIMVGTHAIYSVASTVVGS
jgi:hypothetical protein